MDWGSSRRDFFEGIFIEVVYLFGFRYISLLFVISVIFYLNSREVLEGRYF